MTNYKVYYDYYDGVKVPIWVIVDASKINWDYDILSLHIHAPFDLQLAEDFDTYALNLTITMNELTIRSDMNSIGINLNLLRNRLDEHSIEYNDVSNFVIQLADIEEVLTFTLGD